MLVRAKNYMNKEQLAHVSELTRSNNHTKARIVIASCFPYLAQYKKAFEAIETICNIEKYLPYSLSTYQGEKTAQMIHQIKLTEGQEIVNLIYQTL